MGILIVGYDRDGPAEGNSRMYLFIYALEYWNTFSGVFQLLTSAPFCRRSVLSLLSSLLIVSSEIIF